VSWIEQGARVDLEFANVVVDSGWEEGTRPNRFLPPPEVPTRLYSDEISGRIARYTANLYVF
jgi:hypothetical protein